MSDYLDKIQTQKKDGTPLATVPFRDSEAREDITTIQNELTTDTTTIEGNPLNFTTLSAQTAKSTILSVEPIQDLHGYDKPWVGGAGKNKLPLTVEGIKAANTNGTWSGNVYTYRTVTMEILTDSDNNVIGLKINGKANSGGVLNVFYDNLPSNITVGSSYILSWESILDAFQLISYDSNDTQTVVLNNRGISTNETFTVPNDCVKLQVRIAFNTSVTYSNIIIKPMLRLTTETDATFQPYTNECGISGRTEIGILGCNGENLFNKNTVTTGMLNNDGTIDTSVTTVATSDYIIVKGLTNIVFSGISSSGSSTRGFCIFDAAKNVIANYNMTYIINNPVVTIPNNTVYLRFSVSILFNLNTAKIEVGVTPTAYKPYVESNNITISLGQIVYGGTLDVENGVLVVDMKYDTLPTNNWSKRSDSFSYMRSNIFSDIKPVSGYSTIANIYCDIAKAAKPSRIVDPTVNENGIGIGDGDNKYCYMRIGDDYDTLEKFVTYITNNPVGVCYELATPITIQLTPNAVNLLKGVNNISTDGDKITLTYRDGSVATLGDLTSAVDNLDSKIDESKILTDTATGDKYILVVTNGVLSVEQISN